jgi:uncharacterized NAD-dependent epimerase/dehydratase family protein
MSQGSVARRRSAIVYCEGNFGELDGKTANGLARHSELYEILSVIDSELTGLDAGVVLDGAPSGIPVCRDLAHALEVAQRTPACLIFGVAPASGMLTPAQRALLLEAIGLGMGVVSGLHQFLNDDAEFVAASATSNVELLDVRRPRARDRLQTFSDRIREVTCPRIAVLGTDCAIGKRTTATVVTRALNDVGIKAVLVGTGQTSLIQGARYGVALDSVPSQFCAGEMEAAVVAAFEAERPDVILVEGQGALSHPAYSTSSFILRGARPNGVILQHAPARAHRCDFPGMPMPALSDEINMIETFSDAKVIGLTLNHEGMTQPEVARAITRYEKAFAIPTTDALTEPPGRLVAMVQRAFPELAALVRESAG